MNAPTYVSGDTATPHRVTMKDVSGAVIDPSTGEARLYATGFDNDDKPGAILSGDTRKSVLGMSGPTVVNRKGELSVDFPQIGFFCDIGDGRRAQRYSWRVQFVKNGSGEVWRQDPPGEFVVVAWVE